MKVDGKSDGSPVTEADLAADRIIGAGLARLAPNLPALSEERVAPGDAALQGQLLPGRSARRHQGIRRRPQRVHGQYRAGDGGHAAARHRRRAGAGLIWRGIVGRGAERLTLRDGAALAQSSRSAPGLAAARKTLDGGGQPLAWRCQDRGLHCRSPRRGAGRARLGGEIRPGRRRRGRYLSPPRPRPANGTSRPATRW